MAELKGEIIFFGLIELSPLFTSEEDSNVLEPAINRYGYPRIIKTVVSQDRKMTAASKSISKEHKPRSPYL